MLIRLILITSLFLSFSPITNAEKISIVAPVKSNIVKPAHGTKADDVIDKFGQPEERQPAIGSPPITKWVYKEFTVYFESDTVIHSVINRK